MSAPLFEKEVFMNAEQTVSHILYMIEIGEIVVKWKEWFFSGGRDWGDAHTYSLRLYGGENYGEIIVNNPNGISVRNANGEDIVNELNVSELVDRADRTLFEAVMRDDKELVKCLTDKCGLFELPTDYGDISRANVLNNEWKGVVA